MTLDYCCYCSHFRATHPELLEDVIVTATVLHSAPQKDRRYRDGKYRVIGCPHIRPAFGPHRTNECAHIAIRDTYQRLRESREAETKRLDQLLYGRNQVQIETGTSGTSQGDAGAVQGEEASGTQPVSAAVAPAETGLSSGDDPSVEVAPVCEAGGSIWLQHDLGIDGRCTTPPSQGRRRRYERVNQMVQG